VLGGGVVWGEGSALPPGFEVLWGTTAPGAPRGGIAQARG
jgi:hypothetical protein